MIWIGAVAYAAFVLVALSVAGRRWGAEASAAVQAVFDAIAAACGLVSALISATRGDPVMAGLYAGLAGFFAWRVWSWWNRRRNRRASRVSSRVVDLGHKLAVEKA